jgi:Putative Flp pilus-assembly TadE/G-like
MRRLSSRLTGRLEDERGAVAVMVALLMVPMIGFAALAVDLGNVYAQRARLQTAADAAALAVAQDCARGSCGNMQATANALVAANLDGATAAPPVLSSAPTSVTVTGDKPTTHWFAPVLGINSSDVRATATVAWGFPGGGTAVLPLTFSYCEWMWQTHGGMPSSTTPVTIRFTKTSGTTCTGPSHNIVPGGFAYIDTDVGRCTASTKMADHATSKTGNSVPSSCAPTDFSGWLGQTVLLPLFDDWGQTGNNAWYQVYGYAAFKLTGYYLGGQYSTSPPPCSGNARCISGYFVRYVDLSDRFTWTTSGPDLGADILKLIR